MDHQSLLTELKKSKSHIIMSVCFNARKLSTSQYILVLLFQHILEKT